MMTMPRRPDATDVPDPTCPKCWGSGFIDVPSDAVERVRNVDDRVADIMRDRFPQLEFCECFVRMRYRKMN
jgi:hypothetical protein